jgi:uncharacterized protein YkwD
MRFTKHIVMLFVTFGVLMAASPAAAHLNRTEAGLLVAMNQVRAAHGLAPLHADSTLQRAARAHSVDMLRHNYFSHGAFASRMHAFHAAGPFLGENLAWGEGSAGSPANIVRLWLASPEHRANLLRPGFSRVGLAVPVGAFQGIGGVAMVTADFAGV